MSTKKFGVLVIVLCLIAIYIVPKAQKTTPNKPPITDSTPIISKSDGDTFIKLLGTVPHDNYSQLDPKQVIREFIAWKERELAQKQLSDTTKPKK